MTEPAIRYYGARCGYRCGNAGDEAGPIIVAALSGRRVAWCGVGSAEMVACGSVAQDIPDNYTGDVWGVGLMFEHHRINASDARVHAVRGPMTARRWNGLDPDRVVHGDPGLLAGEVFTRRRPVRYSIGFVPHYVDANNDQITGWVRRNPGVANVIDICGHPDNVIEQLSECAFVVSSSLHGLIFADALGIPNAWVHLSDGVAGGSFKFRDYYATFGYTDIRSMPLHIDMSVQDVLEYGRAYERPGIDDIKGKLREAFPFKSASAVVA